MRFICFILFFLSSYLFGESGFKMNISLPLGGSYVFYDPIFKAEVDPDYTFEYIRYNENLMGLEGGLDISPGYLFDLNNKLGVGVFGTIGYSYDFFATKRLDVREYYHFNSLKLGVDSQLYFNDFAFGVGLGLKVPLYVNSQYDENGYMSTVNYFGHSLYNNRLLNPMFGYIQFSFDYIFDLDDFDLSLGIYLGYDFGLSLKPYVDILESKDFSAIDFGARLSFIIGESI